MRVCIVVAQLLCYLYYYSFKIFPCFWLVETTRMIHHNQLLLTKLGKNFVILNQWHQNNVKKCSPLQEPLTEKTWGWGCAFLEEQKYREQNGEKGFKNGEIFWINSKAIIEFSFHRICLGGQHPPWSAESFISYSASFNNIAKYSFYYE